MKKTLNLGCGNRTFDEYPKGYKCVNVDIRNGLSNVDVICDVTKLDFFESEEADYILASDILEHFPVSKTLSVLREWSRVLKSGGLLEIRVPNLAVICANYTPGNARHTSWLLYGGQDYPENFHYVGFDRQFLCSFIEAAGFKEQSYREEGNNLVMLVKKTT